MPKEFLRSDDQEFERMFTRIEQYIFEASDEEITEALLAQGEDPAQLAERGRKIIALARDRVETDRSSTAVLLRSELQVLKSRVLSVIGLLRLQPQLEVALGDASDNGTDVRQVSLLDAFGVSMEQLRQQLPWCGVSLDIARTFTEEDREPVYSAYASEPINELADASGWGNVLSVTLRGPNNVRCTVRLAAKQMAATFDGELPADLDSLNAELVVQSKE